MYSANQSTVMYKSGPLFMKSGPNLPQKLMDAAAKPDDREIRYLVEQERIPITSTSIFGQTAAHVAAENGRLAILQYVLDAEPSLVSALDKRKQTPLHLAAEKGALHVVRYLVDERNADPFQYGGLRTDNNALHFAAEAGQLPTVRYLIEEKRMDANERNSDHQTAALLAARDDHLDVVRYLAENANANLTVVDCDGRNILYMAASSLNGSLRVPRYVLDQRNVSVDVDWRDKQGITVTYFACRFLHFDTIKYYVSEKRANVNVADNENRTALHLASRLGNIQLIDYLLDHGADPMMADAFGRTPLDTKADKVLFDPKVVERLQAAMDAHRARRSVAEWSPSPLSFGSPASSLGRVSRPLADTDIGGGGGVRLAAANNVLLLANAFLKPGKRRTPQSRHVDMNHRAADSIAVDVIESGPFS